MEHNRHTALSPGTSELAKAGKSVRVLLRREFQLEARRQRQQPKHRADAEEQSKRTDLEDKALEATQCAPWKANVLPVRETDRSGSPCYHNSCRIETKRRARIYPSSIHPTRIGAPPTSGRLPLPLESHTSSQQELGSIAVTVRARDS